MEQTPEVKIDVHRAPDSMVSQAASIPTFVQYLRVNCAPEDVQMRAFAESQRRQSRPEFPADPDIV